MDEKSKILVIGAGTLGFSLFKVLCDAGHDVSIWDIEMSKIAKVFKIDEQTGQKTMVLNRYRWMDDYPFPEDRIVISDRIDATGYDFIILATSMTGLDSVIEIIDNLNVSKTILVTVQKGLDKEMFTPAEVVAFRGHFPKSSILQFTGAGFGKGIAKGHKTRMIIAYDRNFAYAKRFQELFRGTNIWPDFSHDPTGMVYGGILRTIFSPMMAIAQIILKDEPETLAATMAGIEDEYWRILRLMGAKNRTLEDGSPEKKTLLADLRLCQLPGCGSRNTAFGEKLAQGHDLESALLSARKDGVVESYENIGRVYRLICRKLRAPSHSLATIESYIENQFPYLDNLHCLIRNQKTLEQCIGDIISRQQLRF